MGKRKSKTGKQKQAKAAGKQFGVSVKSKGRHDAQKVTVLSSSSSRSVVVAVTVDKNNTKKPQPPPKSNQPFPHLKMSRKNKKQLQKKTSPHYSKSLFGKEMQSAQERSWMVHHPKAIPQTPFRATPATLIINDAHKSTQRLLMEATQQVDTGMQGIGSRHQMTMTTQSSSMALLYQEQSVPLSETTQTNPWAALQEADSSEEDDILQATVKQPLLFAFAPPSFAVNAHDVDPDL